MKNELFKLLVSFRSFYSCLKFENGCNEYDVIQNNMFNLGWFPIPYVS